jgi:hypothetical protein
MALIRGTQGNFPCLICLVLRDDQSDLTKVYVIQTSKQSKDLYKTGLGLTAVACEDLLKMESLQNVEVHILQSLLRSSVKL